MSAIQVRKDNPYNGGDQKTLTMILAGGFMAYKFDNRGKLLASINLHNQPELQAGIVGAGGERPMADIRRRAASS